MKKTRKMVLIEGHTAKKTGWVMVMFILFALFLVGTVSAEVFTIDNKLTYSNEDLKVDFDNLWGFGRYYGSAELKSHPSVNYIKKVGAGDRVVMWYDFDFVDLYKNGFGDVEFTDMKTGEEIDRDYSFVYWGDKERDVYGQGECSLNINGTEFCESVIVGTETYGAWLPYNSKDIPKGNIRIGIKVDVKVDDYVDGVWTIIGKKVSRHSEWTEDLNTNLISCFKLNENSGSTAEDSFGSNNGTYGGDLPTAVGGIIGNSQDYVGGSDYIDVPNVFDFWTNTNIPFAVNMWIYSHEGGRFQRIIDAESGTFMFQKLGTGGGCDNCLRSFSNGIFDAKSNRTIPLNEWAMITTTSDGSTVNIYINGEPVGSDATSSSAVSISTTWIGRRMASSAETWNGLLDEITFFDDSLSVSQITQLYNGGSGITCVKLITLNSPIDTFNTTNSTIFFNGTAISSTLINVSLIIDGIFNETNSSGIEGDYLFTKTISEGDHNWTYEACDDIGCFNATVRTFIIDITAPLISVENPVGTLDYGFWSETLNVTFNDPKLDSCWYNYNGTNVTIDGCVSGVENSTVFILEEGNMNMTIYVNDSVENFNSTFIDWSYKVLQENNYFNSTTLETATESFTVDLTVNLSLTAVILDYNGSDNSMSQSGTNWTTSFDIPLDKLQNNTLRYKFTYAGDTIYSDYFYQNVSLTNLSVCYTGTPFINFTFKDETTNSLINATIDSSTWVYWLGVGSVTKTLLFLNTTENDYYAFCSSVGDRILHNTRSIQYASAGYPQRKYDASSDLTDTTLNKTLWLLSSSDGIYSSIQVIDSKGNRISGVSVTTERQFSGVWTIIGQEETDDSGSVTFWLNPDYDHKFTFVSDDCIGTSVTIRPTQTQYTQQLQCDGTGEDFISQLEGLKYYRTPIEGIIQTGITNFTYFVTSSKYTITNASFKIVSASDSTVLNSTDLACNSDECLLYFTYDVQDGDDIKGRYYVDFGNGSILLEGDARWVNVEIDTAGKAGLSTFWSDLRYVLDDWGEGSNTGDFNRIVVIFFFMCLGIAFLNYHFDIDTQNPGAFMLILAGVILSGSLVGGLDGRGFFYYNNLSPVQFINNYILAFFMIVISGSYFIQVNVQAKR